MFKNVPPLFHQLLHLAKQKKIGDIVHRLCSYENPVSSDPAVIEECIQWVIHTIPFVETQQLLFLCALLGYLAQMNGVSILHLPKNDITKSACDKLLDNLGNCIKKKFPPPRNFLPLLANSAGTIVKGCSKPGWLTLAAHFEWFLGMEYVLQLWMDEYKYNKQEYNQLLSLLVYNLRKVNFHQQDVYHHYLKRILQFAPDDEVLFQLSQDKDRVFRFFVGRDQREKFFVQLIRERLNSGEGTLAEKLAALNQLPEKMRENLHSVIYGIVQHYIDTVADPSSEDMNAVFNLISNLSVESFKTILQSVSKSQLPHRANLFPQLLNDPRFESYFRQISVDDLAQFCRYWVCNQAVWSEESAEKVKATCEALDIIVSCRHVFSDDKVIERLCKCIVDDLRKNDFFVILEGSKNFDDFSECAQYCIERSINDTMKRHFMQNNSKIFKYFTNGGRKVFDR